jgi:cell division septation protein DedD
MFVLYFVSAALVLVGCVPSEETGAGHRVKSPVQIFGPIDTTHRAAHRTINQDTTSKIKIDSVIIVQAKKPRVAPKFKSRQDTVLASIVTKSKSSSHPLIKIIRPEHPVYTVQVGAFGQVSNALQAQKKAKEHFTNQPVFNTYIKRAKLYRVSIGRYENRDDAFALCDSLKQEYPDEYKRCWINFIQ